MPLDAFDPVAAETSAARAVALPVGARVVAAMSGGVDSTVVAALLSRAGYDVVGVTLQLYDHGAAVKKAGACCAGQDIRDARASAERLGVPHYVLDYESRFRQSVIDDFADGKDRIDLSGYHGIEKFSDLHGKIAQSGHDVVITFAGHDRLTIEHAHMSEFSAGDFIF